MRSSYSCCLRTCTLKLRYQEPGGERIAGTSGIDDIVNGCDRVGVHACVRVDHGRLRALFDNRYRCEPIRLSNTKQFGFVVVAEQVVGGDPLDQIASGTDPGISDCTGGGGIERDTDVMAPSTVQHFQGRCSHGIGQQGIHRHVYHRGVQQPSVRSRCQIAS